MTRLRYFAGVILIAGLGILGLGFTIISVSQRSIDGLNTVSIIFFQLLLSLTLIAAGLWLARIGLDAPENTRLVGWVGIGSVLIAGLAYAGSGIAEQIPGAGIEFPVGTLLGGTAGGVIGLLLGLYDILQHRERQELRMQREQETRRVGRLTVLNRVLRHDIRNHINVILGYLERIDHGFDDVEMAHTVMERHAEEIMNLSQQSREIEQLIREDREAHTTVDLVEVVTEEVAKAEAEHVGVEFPTELPETAPVTASRLIDVAIRNIIENAIEHNDKPTSNIDISVQNSGRQGYSYVLQVEDNGPGLPDIERQVLDEGRETELRHSSGLGLWIIHWIVQESDGEIEILSADNGGTVIEIHLAK